MSDCASKSLTLREQQLLFANHLRNPQQFSAPEGVAEERLQVYRELFFSNISQLLSGAFPVIRQILSDAAWQCLVRDFYTEHRSQTPLFPWVAGEFVEYLWHERQCGDDFPFLAELAHYEWSESALLHEEKPSSEELTRNKKSDKPSLSPWCWPLMYRFPVHRIGVDYLPQQAESVPVCLLMYRNANDEVKFIESNPATFHLLQLLEDDALINMEAVLEQLVRVMLHPQPAVLQQALEETVQQLRAIGVLY